MNPLTVTWPPILYTKYGYKNFNSWLQTGKFSNISAKRDEETMIKLTKLAVMNLCTHFKHLCWVKKLSHTNRIKKNIPLVFYGENEAEHGNPIADNKYL